MSPTPPPENSGASAPTSRQRYSRFLDDFRANRISQGDDRGDANGDHDDAARGERKQKRRGYLRAYIRELWPHKNKVVILIAMSLVIAGLDMVQPLFFRYIVDDILLNESLGTTAKLVALNTIGLIVLGFVVVSQSIGVFRNYQQFLLNVRVILSLRRALFHRMLHLPLGELSEMKTGGIISRLTDDVNTTTGLLQMAIVSPGVALVRLSIAIGILFYLNWQLALTAVSIIPFVMAISFIAARKIRPIYRRVRKDVSHVDGRVGEAFQGIRAVRAFLGEHREEHEYTVGHNTITRMKAFARRRELILWGSWSFLMAAIGLVIFWVGGYLNVQGSATIGDITAFQVYTFMLLNPVWQIVNSFSELQRSLAAMERVFEVLEMPADKPDQIDARHAPGAISEIEFRNVWFAYENDQFVIEDFDLSVPGGSVVALVGKSGAGKTTVTDLIARFYDPSRGAILLNGIDIRQLTLRSYRDLLGVVQQEVFLFDGTVRENIAYAQREATEQAIVNAARRANAHEFIVGLPDGYDTIIGERGVKLSGGQRQRLSIARALLADPRILILDEATSNLDTESEQLIQDSLNELLKNRTTFMIAHRLSTITHADQIVVMDGGRIVEAGTHEELIDRNGVYAEMIERQQDAMSL